VQALRPLSTEPFEGLKGMKVTLGGQNGKYSGDTSCFMCYYPVGAVKRDNSGKRYIFPRPPFSRQHFCTSTEGTAYNAPGNLPFPLFGDAHPKRGKCKDQICVNDAHINSGEHDRDYDCPP
jgi:hypothetical protein